MWDQMLFTPGKFAFFRKAKEADKPFFLTVRYIDLHRDLTRSGFGNTEDLTDPRIKPSSYPSLW